MFYNYLCIHIFLFFNIFNWFGSVSDQIPEDDKMMHLIVNEIADEIAPKYQSQLFGIGCGADDQGRFRIIDVSFQFFREINPNEGRQIILEVVNKLVDKFNNDDRIKKYATVPFNERNVKVRLFMDKPDRSEYVHPNYSIISYYQNTISYRTRNPINEFQYDEIISESYEEALQKNEALQVQNEK